MPKILVADDNTNIQKMVSLALEERGINVVSVGNGEAAVRRIPDVDPDLVLADIFMPVRNGYEVCEFVKKDDRFAHVPVILLVGAFDPLDEKEARRVGADGVLKKPFVPPDPLIAMVTSALEKNPRVAAELAKAKEVKMPAPEPDPLPAIDLSSRPEPKPLPEFPEPSAEESALVYGMGKGQRSLDREDVRDAENAPGYAATPRDEAADDDEAGAETSSDWRRSAMDFEIPADLAGQPAVPSMDDLEPINFPSEKDVPPRHVRAPEPIDEARPAVKSEPVSGASEFSLREIDDAEAGAESAAPLPYVSRPEPAPEPPAVSSRSTLDSAPASGPLPEPNSTAAGGHWLDAVASAQAEQPAAGWLDSLSARQSEPPAGHAPDPASAETKAVSASGSASIPELEVPGASGVSAPVFSDAEPQPQHGDPQTGPHVEAAGEQSFFADELEHEAVVEPASENHGSSEFFANAQEAAGRDIELDADDSEPPLAFKDPALVEPPAVHVTPEPLLVDEEESAAAQYGAPAEETSPLHSFFAPAPEVPVAGAEFSAQSQAEPSGAPGEEVDERVPTMPPPNREALSHIPFLTPPPSFLAELNSDASEQEPPVADPHTVDAVVQKVLEKLQPQLQELISQGLLKPLVENILQNEVSKKH